jgi:hypothetical protein
MGLMPGFSSVKTTTFAAEAQRLRRQKLKIIVREKRIGRNKVIVDFTHSILALACYRGSQVAPFNDIVLFASFAFIGDKTNILPP